MNLELNYYLILQCNKINHLDFMIIWADIGQAGPLVEKDFLAISRHILSLER